MRTAEMTRNTFETNISLTINLDGKGNHDIDTGIGFFDHMLTHVSKHGFIDLNIKAVHILTKLFKILHNSHILFDIIVLFSL